MEPPKFDYEQLNRKAMEILAEVTRIPAELLGEMGPGPRSLHDQYSVNRFPELGEQIRKQIWNSLEWRLVPGDRYLAFTRGGQMYLWRCWRMIYAPQPERRRWFLFRRRRNES